ncbi:MAG: fumarate reductase subunit C [Acidobacteria bacterium]|nr:fumarate reductase subunit C [Acidobacteriota bacterium]
MNETPAYTEFHPRWYRPRVSTYWWLWRWPYLKFIIRELSSLSVVSFVVMALLQLSALRRGPQAYAEFQELVKHPFLIALAAVSLFFVVFHAITWFNLTPSAMPVRVKGKRLPDFLVAAPNYVVWLVLSGAVAWVVLGG